MAHLVQQKVEQPSGSESAGITLENLLKLMNEIVHNKDVDNAISDSEMCTLVARYTEVPVIKADEVLKVWKSATVTSLVWTKFRGPVVSGKFYRISGYMFSAHSHSFHELPACFRWLCVRSVLPTRASSTRELFSADGLPSHTTGTQLKGQGARESF